MVNGPTSSALTAPGVEARLRALKVALSDATPPCPGGTRPNTGGKRAHFGCPHCPRCGGQTRAVKGRSLTVFSLPPGVEATRGRSKGAAPLVSASP